MILLLFYTFYLAIAYTKPITGGDEMLPYRVDLQNDPAYILELLPGIGPTRALQIVEYRKSNAITSPQDLVNVHGIGQKTVDELWRLTICGSDPE
jgi:predicted DNA-binding helix-hairpin-helix protein